MVGVVSVLVGVSHLLVSIILPLSVYIAWKLNNRTGFALVLFLTILWYIYLGLSIGIMIG